ncbi:MAG TPA: FmdB family zinc ribbon protein [Rectinemataceae bacterium]|nr:FmdB family zinc ribbon protein [Rectinemataceae bacterium]
MPTYEYECTSCGKNFDVFQNMSDAPLSACPTCGGGVKRRINGGTGVIFKGSGFYKNDSRKSAPASSKDSSGPSSACEGCPASTAPDTAKKEAV